MFNLLRTKLLLSLAAFSFLASPLAYGQGLERGDNVLLKEGETLRLAEFVGNDMSQPLFNVVKFGQYKMHSGSVERIDNPESYLKPMESNRIQLGDTEHDVNRGLLIVTNDNRVFQIDDIFEEDKVLASEIIGYKRTLQDIEPLRSNFVGPTILDLKDIRGVQVDSFRGVKASKVGERVASVDGIPICAKKALLENISASYRSHHTELACTAGGKIPIDAVFSDGTVMVKSAVFNPFPQTIQNYQSAEELERTYNNPDPDLDSNSVY